LHKTIFIGTKQKSREAWQKNVRRFVCPAGRERTFEGVPIYGGGGRIYNFLSKYAKMAAKKSCFSMFPAKLVVIWQIYVILYPPNVVPLHSK
jgi:hypothetical protein